MTISERDLKYALGRGGDATLVKQALDNIDAIDSIDATEAGYINGTVAGTQAASKVIVNDANANQGIAKVTQLHIGTSGSETQVTSTAAELNILDGVTSTAAELNILDGVTATAAELNQHCDESANTEVVITTNVIAANESGKTFYLDLVDGFTSTLPAPAAGLRFRFIVKTAPTTAYIITTTNGDNILYGHMLERAGGAGVAGAARDTFNFVASQAIIGDWVEFYSDGTNYYYHGMVDVAAGNTVGAT